MSQQRLVTLRRGGTLRAYFVYCYYKMDSISYWTVKNWKCEIWNDELRYRYTIRGIKKETSWRSRNRNQYLMSEVLALAVEALVPLRRKTVNCCLVKFPGLRCEPVPHVLLDVVV